MSFRVLEQEFLILGLMSAKLAFGAGAGGGDYVILTDKS